MLATYERAWSYEDFGEVRIRRVTRYWPDRVTVLGFSTAFVRPETFRYACTDMSSAVGDRKRYLIWKKGDDVRSWWSNRPDVRANQPFELTIASATGVSGGSAARIIALLLPDLQWGRKLRLLDDVRLSGQVELEGTSCYQLQALGLDGAPVEIWIDTRTFLLRQIREQRQLDGVRTETTTIYRSPRVNGPIDPQQLVFDPSVNRNRGKPIGQIEREFRPWGYLIVLALVNLLHCRLRPGTRLGYVPGRREAAIFASLAIGALVALLLVRASWENVMIAVCLHGTLLCVYTLWRRERTLSELRMNAAQPRT